MPIYAYRCSACGFEKDVLQKLSDAPLTVCPSCGQAQFAKKLTAPNFQLKGTGWYVTDFRDGDKGKKAAEGDAKATGGDTNAGGDAKAADTSSSPSTSPAPAPAPAAAPAPAPASGGGTPPKAA